MKVQAAVLNRAGEQYKIEEIELDGPKQGEVLVELAASGLCHSDDHLMTGDVPLPGPMVAGHEGSGVVVEVGPGVTRAKVGDHVIMHAVPNCGQCRWCATGHPGLCDVGAFALTGYGPDGTYRRRLDGVNIAAFCQLGTFATHTTISETQVVPIPKDMPLRAAALIGCGVTTGVGAATTVAETKPGDVVVVLGTGGVGTAAVQGARIAGATTIVAVDPLEPRRTKALDFGATHAFASAADAFEMVTDHTEGVMADRVIITVGVMHGDLFGEALNLTRKGGRCVLTSVAPVNETAATVSLFELSMLMKEVRGHIYGDAQPRETFRRMISLYRSGLLKLDEMITTEYSLDQINDGVTAMHDGSNTRGCIVYT